MPPERIWMCPPESRSASARSSSTWAITLRAVFAWQMIRTVFTAALASALLPRPLPEPHAALEILPLAGRALVQLSPEVRARRPDEIGAEGLRDQLHQLGGGEAAVRVEPADGLRLGEDGVAVEERVERLAVDAGRGIAGEIDHERGDVVGVA